MSFLFVLQEDPTVENLQKIADDCTENEIGIVKINDRDEAESYGLDDKMPVILYFENKVMQFSGNSLVAINYLDHYLKFI